MADIQDVLARVFVADLNTAVPFYESLTGQAAHRFAFRDVQLARVGSFLLLAGDTQAFRDRVATVLVKELQPVIDVLAASGGSVIEGPAPAPNGARMITRHPDGSVFEYIESGA
jgi:predicted enzyme related to lactoylglutathione lyase